MLPKLRLVTFSCLKNAKNRVGILQDNKSVIDLSTTSQKPAFMDMLNFIDGGKSIVKEAKDIAKNPPANSLIDEKDVVLKAPIPLPRLSNAHAAATKFA
jgi:hypothetical protein